ncbi:MAG: insulinase family protein, partial [Pseudomonadota bacterium]
LHYAPNNAILIVAGDVTPDQVRELAQQTYGKLPANPKIEARDRPSDPIAKAPRRVTLTDARAGKPVFRRAYTAPSYQTDKPGDAEALDLLMKVVASGATSRMYRELVVEKKIASSISGYYAGHGLDSGKILFGGVPADGVTLEKLEAEVDRIIADVKKNGVSEKALERAKKVYSAEHIYEIDNQSSLARRYGWGLVVGATIEEIDGWPDALAKVTTADVKRVANEYLDITQSVTGYLRPKTADVADAEKQTAPKADRS